MKRTGWGIVTPEGQLTTIFEKTRAAAIETAVSSFGYVMVQARYWPQLRREGWRAVKIVLKVAE